MLYLGLIFLTDSYLEKVLLSLWKWIFRCHGKGKGIHGSLLKICVLTVAVQNMCLCAPAFLCSSNICCCSSSSVLHTIFSLYDFSKDYLITFLCFMCDQEFLILKFGDIILLICRTKSGNFFFFRFLHFHLISSSKLTKLSFHWRITGECNLSPMYIFTKQNKLFMGHMLLTFKFRKG